MIKLKDKNDVDIIFKDNCIYVKNKSVNFFGRSNIFNRSLDDVEDVIFNGPATIVKWNDGGKTVVKCAKGDMYDKEKGLAMAILKGQMHTDKGDGKFHKFFDKWIVEDEDSVGDENAKD